MARLFITFVEISVGTSVLIAGLLLVSPLLARRYPAKTQCAVWCVLALRLLVPATFHLIPPISIPVPDIGGFVKTVVVSPAVPFKAEDVAVPAVTIPGQTAASVQAGESARTDPTDGEPARTGPSAGDILVTVWAAGALTFAAVRLTGYGLLRRRVRRSAAPVDDAAALALFRGVLSDMRIREGRVALLRLPGASGPMMTGLLHPVILMPEELVSDPEELALIFRHELTHYKRRHIWFKLILMCANAAHWFNPLVWLMARAAGAQLENACDQEIVRGADFSLRKKYCRSILSAAALGQRHKTGLKACLNGGKKSIKKRFIGIFDQTAKKRGAPLVAVVMLAVLFAGALVSCATADMSENDAYSSRLTVAKHWADAVKDRDGKAQYELMAKSLQAEVYDEYSGLNWVTGTSSPCFEAYKLKPTSIGVRVTFHYAVSTGSFGYFSQKLTFTEEDGQLKISDITEPDVYGALPSHDVPTYIFFSGSPNPAQTSLSMRFLGSLFGMTEEEVKTSFKEAPVTVDDGGLGFEEAGIRVWFDSETHTKVAKVLVMTAAYDLNGVRVGDSYEDFKAVFGEPVSDQNGEALFGIGTLAEIIGERDTIITVHYGQIYLSIVRDIDTDITVAAYFLTENYQEASGKPLTDTKRNRPRPVSFRLQTKPSGLCLQRACMTAAQPQPS